MNTEHMESAGVPALDELLQIEPSAIRSLVDCGVHLEGRLTVCNSSPILISGEVTGEIVSEGVVIINSDATVNGSIRAKGLQVGGRITRRNQDDRIDVEGVLVLAKGARLEVDAIYGDLKAEHGVRISGNLSPRELADEGSRGSQGAQVVPLSSASSHS